MFLWKYVHHLELSLKIKSGIADGGEIEFSSAGTAAWLFDKDK
jgi:hypothetical protein